MCPSHLHPSRRVHLCGLRLYLALLAISILFRFPALLNAGGVHSDAAIVGLQARHILQGEWSWFLWGAGYQGSLDALLIALGFVIAGATPLVLMVVPLIGHLLLTWFVFDVLRKRLGLGLAGVATLIVVFTPYAINGVALYAPRQWCITFVFAAIWLLDGACESRRPLLRYAAGTMISVFALYLDLYALQFMVGLGVFAIACSLDRDRTARQILRRIGACGVGCAIGLFLVWMVRQSPEATSYPTTLSLGRIPVNLKLLWDSCLPWVLGYRVFIPWKTFYIPGPWNPPILFQIVQIVGAASLMLAVLVGGLAVFLRDMPWSVRRLGLLGFVVTASSIAGFLISTMPHDAWGARYLAPIVWTAPFAIAPVAWHLRAKRFVLAIAPYLISAAIGGWVSFGLYLQGPLPIQRPRGVAIEEAGLGEVLRLQGVRYAAADYWLAYRLTFLWEENPIVIPLNQDQDRYAPYRQAFDQADRVALIFHPWVPSAIPEPYEAWLQQSRASYQRITVADFTVLIVQKGPCKPWPCLERRSSILTLGAPAMARGQWHAGYAPRRAPQIKQVFAFAPVVGALTLPLTDAGQTMIHRDPLAQLGTFLHGYHTVWGDELERRSAAPIAFEGCYFDAQEPKVAPWAFQSRGRCGARWNASTRCGDGCHGRSSR